MLYKKIQLLNLDRTNHQRITERYINKVLPRRKEFKNLKWHEIDFLFQSMKIMKKNSGEYAFDLMKYPEAKYYVLYCIILTYGTSSQYIDFSKRDKMHNDSISSNKGKKTQFFFYKHIDDWIKELGKGDGPYYSVIKPMYERKMKELSKLREGKEIDNQTYIRKVIYLKACFFHIYYNVRLYFDECEEKADLQHICGFDVYADIYSYSHVLSRHYYPIMNKNSNVTMNDDIPEINIRTLPNSLLNLIKLYSSEKSIDRDTQYLLYRIKDKPYILWLKYGEIPILKRKEGFEIRSFYRCEEQTDLDKYNGTKNIPITKNIAISIPKS